MNGACALTEAWVIDLREELELLKSEAQSVGADGHDPKCPLIAKLVTQEINRLKDALHRAEAHLREVCSQSRRVSKDDPCLEDYRCQAQVQYICQCRLTHNFYVHSNSQYFNYFGDDDAFRKEYGSMENDELEASLEDVKAQAIEREQGFRFGARVHQNIIQHYKPPHPHLRDSTRLEEYLHPSFLECVEICKATLTSVDDLAEHHKLGFKVIRSKSDISAGIFSLAKIFTDEFCSLLFEDLIAFAESKLEYTRPNSMNRNGGVLLYELGFKSLLDRFVFEFFNPVAKVLFPEDLDGGDLDSHKVFTVAYQADDFNTFDRISQQRLTTLRAGASDSRLAVHTDNAEATLNLHLAGEWTGGGLHCFGKDLSKIAQPGVKLAIERDSSEVHGLTVMHSGSEFHEALSVETGWRLNLVFWLRSSKVRNKKCPFCWDTPKVVELPSLGGEGFTSPPCELSTVKLF